MSKGGYAYIMTNKPFGPLYVGVTANLAQRVFQHRTGTKSKHFKRYGLTRLVYVEEYPSIEEAIARKGNESMETALEDGSYCQG